MRSKPIEKSVVVLAVQVRLQVMRAPVVLGGRVGILAADNLEGFYVLERQVVTQRETVLLAPGLVEHPPHSIVVDRLRGVGVEGAWVDVRSIWEFVGIGSQDPLDHCAGGGVIRAGGGVIEDRGPLVWALAQGRYR